MAVYDPKTSSSAGYANGAGAIADTLSRARGIKAEKIKDFSPETLAWYDAVVVPNFGNDARTDRRLGARTCASYVLNGGAALLCHRSGRLHPLQVRGAAGSRPERPLGAANKTRDMAVVATLIPSPPTWWCANATPDDYSNPAFKAQIDANAFKVGDTFRTGFCDYIALKPGKGATVLVKGSDGNPALVAGTAGQRQGGAVRPGSRPGRERPPNAWPKATGNSCATPCTGWWRNEGALMATNKSAPSGGGNKGRHESRPRSPSS